MSSSPPTPDTSLEYVIFKVAIVNTPPSGLTTNSGSRPLLSPPNTSESDQHSPPVDVHDGTNVELYPAYSSIRASLNSPLHWVVMEFCRQRRMPPYTGRHFTLYSHKGDKLPLSSRVQEYYSGTPSDKDILLYIVPNDTPSPPAKHTRSSRHSSTSPSTPHRRVSLLYFNNCATMTNPKACQAWMFLGLLGLLIGLAGITIIIVLGIVGNLKAQYAVVIDAGSSSSKVQLYTWQESHYANAAVTQLGETCRTKRGISDWEDAPANSSLEILACLGNKPFTDIPPLAEEFVHLYLGATAGMRMLSYSNWNASEAILSTLRQRLSESKYRLPEPNSQVRIITGTEEAINAWITVNYLLENFGKFTSGTLTPAPVAPEDTVGSLDLGGASTQITFIPESSAVASNVTTRLNLFGRQYDIFGHSFLCYGKHEVEYRQLALLLKKHNFSAVVENPCVAKGLVSIYTPVSIFTAPCVKGHFALEAFGEEITPPDQLPVTFNVSGSGDVAACRKDFVQPFFQTQKYRDVKIPAIRGRFQAFAGYYFVLNHLRLAPTTSLVNFTNAVQRACETTPDKRGHLAAFNEEWYCFDGIYIEELLKSFGFNDSNWEMIDFVESVQGSSVSWSLGFMIEQSGHLPDEMPSFLNQYFSLAVFILLLCLMVGIILCACVFLVAAWRHVRSEDDIAVGHGDEGVFQWNKNQRVQGSE